MTSITFTDFHACDTIRPMSLEDTWMRYGSWAGIQNFNFLDLAAEATVHITGTSTWTRHPVTVVGPPNLTLLYHKTATRQAAYVLGSSTISLYVGTDESGYPTIWDGLGVVLQKVPVVAPSEADVEITFRQQVLDDTGTNIWCSLTLTMNGKWITSYTKLLTETVGVLEMGLAAYSTDVVTYTSVRIPELCETAEFGTTDPGENAFGGLSRTIEGRYLFYYVRYDGSLRVWRKKARDSVLTFSHSPERFQKTQDLTQLVTHARMMGAYIWGESANTTLLAGYGHRFQEVNNPNLLTEEECDTEADNTLKRAEEHSFGATMVAQHVPLLEPEDRITAQGSDWLINDYNFEVLGGDNRATYNLRRYVWGS